MEELLEFYEICYGGGKIPKKERLRLLRRAMQWLELLTRRDAALRLEYKENMWHAVCAAADAIYELEKSVVLKEQNGDLSITYAARLSTTERQLVWQALFPYLAWTGLLYRGVRAC